MKKLFQAFSGFSMCYDRSLAFRGRAVTSSSSASRGMTLVELLAASVLLSIIIGFVLMLYTQSWAASIKDNEKLSAAHIAQYVLEEWLAEHDYQEVKDKMITSPLTITLGEGDVLDDIWAKISANNSEYQKYTPKIELAYADTSRNSGPIRVTITIESKNVKPVILHGIKTEPKPE